MNELLSRTTPSAPKAANWKNPVALVETTSSSRAWSSPSLPVDTSEWVRGPVAETSTQ